MTRFLRNRQQCHRCANCFRDYTISPLLLFRCLIDNQAREQNGRSYKIASPNPRFSHRRTRSHQTIHPLYACSHKCYSHRPCFNTSVRLRPRGHTMGRSKTGKPKNTIMVQMRESAESGGVQGEGCISRIDKVARGGWVGSCRRSRERCSYA